jgi:hypothetical protein
MESESVQISVADHNIETDGLAQEGFHAGVPEPDLVGNAVDPDWFAIVKTEIHAAKPLSAVACHRFCAYHGQPIDALC